MIYDDLVARLVGALEGGEIEPSQVEALLRRRKAASGRPGVSSVLRAAGALVCLTGAALLYGIGFSSYPGSAQAITPFLFPVVALGGAIVLHRARRPAWEVELAAWPATSPSASRPSRLRWPPGPARASASRPASPPRGSCSGCTRRFGSSV